MISVVLCTHNPRLDYIGRTINGLRTQTLPENEWELVVVDNASVPPVSASIDIGWHAAGRICREETLGLTPARLRGIRETSGEVIVFVDDDNVLAPDYLERAAKLGATHAWLGSWSGSVTGEFETAPPAWTRRYWGNLVLREVGKDAWSNVPELHSTMPLGAGFCVRRIVASEYLRLHETGIRAMTLDREGASLVSGGDNDLALCALDVGLGCGLIAALHVTHLIPPVRLTEDYLLRLIEAVSYSSIILKSFRNPINAAPVRRDLAGRAADFVRRTRMSSRERRFDDAVRKGRARAERQLSL